MAFFQSLSIFLSIELFLVFFLSMNNITVVFSSIFTHFDLEDIAMFHPSWVRHSVEHPAAMSNGVRPSSVAFSVDAWALNKCCTT